MSESQQYTLHWRGQESGPFSLGKIKRKLASGEISLEHEILVDGQWTTLHEFLAKPSSDPLTEASQPINAAKAPVVPALSSPSTRPKSDPHGRRRLSALAILLLLLMGAIWLFLSHSPGAGPEKTRSGSASKPTTPHAKTEKTARKDKSPQSPDGKLSAAGENRQSSSGIDASHASLILREPRSANLIPGDATPENARSEADGSLSLSPGDNSAKTGRRSDRQSLQDLQSKSPRSPSAPSGSQSKPSTSSGEGGQSGSNPLAGTKDKSIPDLAGASGANEKPDVPSSADKATASSTESASGPSAASHAPTDSSKGNSTEAPANSETPSESKEKSSGGTGKPSAQSANSKDASSSAGTPGSSSPGGDKPAKSDPSSSEGTSLSPSKQATAKAQSAVSDGNDQEVHPNSDPASGAKGSNGGNAEKPSPKSPKSGGDGAANPGSPAAAAHSPNAKSSGAPGKSPNSKPGSDASSPTSSPNGKSSSPSTQPTTPAASSPDHASSKTGSNAASSPTDSNNANSPASSPQGNAKTAQAASKSPGVSPSPSTSSGGAPASLQSSGITAPQGGSASPGQLSARSIPGAVTAASEVKETNRRQGEYELAGVRPNVVFLVDQSYSMRGAKGEAASHQLSDLMAKLDPNTTFYIIFFHSSGYDPMPSPIPLPATKENVQAMLEWSSTVRHVFGSKPEKAVGRALDLHPRSVWLISDGKFPKNAVAAVTASNKTIKAVINTVGIESHSGEENLRDLADKNGGVYRFVPAR